MAENALDVEVEDTTGNSSLEENADNLDSSQDTSADAPLKADKSTRDKANERIRDLIEQRNNLAAQLQQVQNNQGKNTPRYEYEGVTSEGIDPEKFAASLQQNTLAQTKQITQNEVAFQVELMEVRKDPVMKSLVAQEHVSSLINRSIRPLEALEIYKDDLKKIEAEFLERNKSRKEATSNTREGTTVISSGKTTTQSGLYTMAQVDAMPIAEYKKNVVEIKRQLAAGLLK